MTHAYLYLVPIFVYIKDFLEFSAVSSLDFLHNIFKSLYLHNQIYVVISYQANKYKALIQNFPSD